ncbi:hypothetical protein Clacol_007312 [Clathrus columnatus]|uniref:Uncharacterized protein n=1 Tax=Clathrus columnatus TaxID=1419009 RepID=A0AAV5AK44_9AGAM|nr:hypothetical protein Clacol_007312 [Clathrus columnatus]
MITSTNLDEPSAEYRVLPAPLSLLSVRRPSLVSLPPDSTRVAPKIPSIVAQPNEEFLNPTSSRRSHTEEEDSNMADLNQGLEIKMEGWMSISPSGRDVVLAARSGLYVIDLEMPLEVPRFIPQGGTWDVADVQWNPHPSRGNLVVSTSSEKLLIWNLDRADRSAIQHILSKHYRSITDVNWHNHHPDVVSSTGIDSWIWVWDLRTALKPVAAGATQVKWNRHNENILASSHGNMLLVWDQRKGAVPLTIVKAHSSRIYGVDWSRTNGNEIATCSLDRTIKFWDAGPGWYRPSNTTSDNSTYVAHSTFAPSSYTLPTMQPTRVIHLHYPVWRSRYAPFGNSVLSLPQRGFQRPELLRFVDKEFDETGYEPIYPIPEGAAGEGIVKEYVWRVKGGLNSSFDDREFQLVTWNEDRTIRAWPIGAHILEVLVSDPSVIFLVKQSLACWSHPRNLSESLPERPHDQHVSGGPEIHSGPLSSATNLDSMISKTSKKPVEGTATIKRGGTMTKGPSRFKNINSFGMHALTWMPSVKTVGRGQNVSNGTWNVGLAPESLESSVASLDSFKFGNAYVRDEWKESADLNAHNTSQSRIVDARESGASEPRTTLTWAEELISVVNGLKASKAGKISLEKFKLEKRMCILGLQGPWGESSSVFVRVTFVFPKDYPRSTVSPQIDLERNHLIPVKRRAMLLRELRSLGRSPPCLEPCLRLLLGLPIEKEGVLRKVVEIDSGSSSEDESMKALRGKEGVVPILGQGLAELRTSQGVFSPNGQLVIFTHVLVRMVRNASRNISLSPSTNPRVRSGSRRETHQASGGLSDALRRLAAIAQDRKINPVTVGMDEDLLRTLETLSYSKLYPALGVTTTSGTGDSGYLVKPVRKSRVSIRDLTDVTGLDPFVARSYVVSAANATSFCLQNAEIAKSLNRTDHERMFRTLASLVEITPISSDLTSNRTCNGWWNDYLGRSIIISFLCESIEKKDVLILAMISTALLIADRDYMTLSTFSALIP